MNVAKRDFDKEAIFWDKHPRKVKLAKDIAHSVSNQVALTPEMDIMDFGCGTGLLTIHLQPLVRSITGVDSSRGMIDVFNLKINELKLNNVNTMIIDLEKGDTLTGNYNLVLCSMTLHHIKEVKPLFDQFHKIIAPAGYLCIADLDLHDGQFHDDNTGVFHFGFSRAALSNIFIETGFGNVWHTGAAELVKPDKKGKITRFTIFLMTGQKISQLNDIE